MKKEADIITQNKRNDRFWEQSLFSEKLVEPVPGDITKIGWSYDYRISYERSLSIFLSGIEGIERLQVGFGHFKTTYNQLLAHNLRAFEFINTWRRLSRIVGPKASDRITGVGRDERSGWNHEVREGDRNKLTGVIAYDLYNRITADARQASFTQRKALESLGGSMVDLNRN
jgi:hypothetical protein